MSPSRWQRRRRPLASALAAAATLAAIGLASGAAEAMHLAWDQNHDPVIVDVEILLLEEIDDCRSQPSPFIAATQAYTRVDSDVFVPGKIPLEIIRSFHGRDHHSGMLGRGWTFNYGIHLMEVTNGADTSVVVRLANGQRRRFTRNPDGSYATPPGARATLERAATGRFTLTFLDGTVVRFNKNGAPIAIVDRNGHSLALAYDSAQFLVRVTDDNGRSLVFSKGANGKIATVTDPANRIVRYAYDAAGDLVRVTDPTGAVTEYTYDEHGNLTSVIDPRGNVEIEMTYDANGRLTAYVEGDVTTTLSEDRALRKVMEQDSTGNRRTILYDQGNRITSITDPLGNVESYEYDARGNTVAVRDKGGHTTRYTYDSLDRVTSIVDALGHTTRFTYEPAANRVASRTDVLGNTTTFAYDARGNPLRLADDTGAELNLGWDVDGQLTSIVDPTGTTTLAYDANGYLTRVTDPAGGITSFGWGAAGNVSRTNPSGATTSLLYDGAGRLTRVVDDLGGVTRYTYDASGNLLSLVDPNGRTTSAQYDALNRMTRLIDPLNRQTVFTYDARGRLSRVTDGNNRTTVLQYDRLDRLISRIPPGNTYSYAYDADGNLTAANDNDSEIDLVYDALDRVIQVSTGATDGQPASTISYTYDAAGNRLTMTDPLGGLTTSAYDEAGKVREILNPRNERTTFDYDAAGRLSLMTLANGATRRLRYDPIGLVSRIVDSVAGRFDVSRDALLRPRTIAAPGGADGYAYDAIDRLTQATHPAAGGPTESYAYDAAGNRKSSHLSTAYSYDAASQLLSDDRFTYTYDGNGNLRRKTARSNGAVTEYLYDAEDQLIEIDYPNRTKSTFRYDAFGRRIERNSKGTVRRFVYDFDDVLVQYDDANTANTRYTPGPGIDVPISMERNGASLFFHYDALRNVAKLSDASRNVVRSYTYDTFGRILAQPGSIANAVTFQGRELDADSDLYYFRARYYDPSTGRFLQRDPAARLAPDNAYAFAANDPVLFGDPSGRTVTYYYWRPTYGPNGLQNVGHAALGFDSAACRGFVSFFPSGSDRDKKNASAGELRDLPGSIDFEGAQPSGKLDLTGMVDEGKLCEWLKNKQKKPGRFALYYSNCSTTVGEALGAAGPWQFKIPYPAWPELVLSRLLVRKGDYLGGGGEFVKSLGVPFGIIWHNVRAGLRKPSPGVVPEGH